MAKDKQPPTVVHRPGLPWLCQRILTSFIGESWWHSTPDRADPIGEFWRHCGRADSRDFLTQDINDHRRYYDPHHVSLADLVEECGAAVPPSGAPFRALPSRPSVREAL
ncbi:hypothetical protein ACIHDR_46650 [Nocardia sp. NPDC052278]|uniref:hypothetical protein n=1 Tax=Nocardia sp. NPDC052278 TaxID=3364328 RepID=UPI0037C6DA08